MFGFLLESAILCSISMTAVGTMPMQPRTIDIPEKNELVKGVYDIPEDAGTIKVKITDLLSESLEVEVR